MSDHFRNCHFIPKEKRSHNSEVKKGQRSKMPKKSANGIVRGTDSVGVSASLAGLLSPYSEDYPEIPSESLHDPTTSSISIPKSGHSH